MEATRTNTRTSADKVRDLLETASAVYDAAAEVAREVATGDPVYDEAFAAFEAAWGTASAPEAYAALTSAGPLAEAVRTLGRAWDARDPLFERKFPEASRLVRALLAPFRSEPVRASDLDPDTVAGRADEVTSALLMADGWAQDVEGGDDSLLAALTYRVIVLGETAEDITDTDLEAVDIFEGSSAQWAGEYLDESGDIPDYLFSYIDFARFARDAEQNGDIYDLADDGLQAVVTNAAAL